MPRVMYEGTGAGQADKMRVGRFRFTRGEATEVDEETARRLAKVKGYKVVRERAAKDEAPAEAAGGGTDG